MTKEESLVIKQKLNDSMKNTTLFNEMRFSSGNLITNEMFVLSGNNNIFFE
jgi:hypothetical protein